MSDHASTVFSTEVPTDLPTAISQVTQEKKTTTCIAQQYVAEPRYSFNRGSLTVYVPNNTELTTVGRALVEGFNIRFESGECKAHFEHWTIEGRCPSGSAWVTDGDSGNPLFALNTANNYRLRMKASERQDVDNPYTWGCSSSLVWLDPGHRFVVTESDSLYTMNPAGFKTEKYFTWNPEEVPVVLAA